MARRKDPFNKRDSKWGLNLVSTLIAWSIAAPFAIGSSLSKNTSYVLRQKKDFRHQGV